MARDWSMLWVVLVMGAVVGAVLVGWAVLNPQLDATLPFPNSGAKLESVLE